MSTLHIIHGCRTIQLGKGLNTLIDESDFELVGSMSWHGSWNRFTWYVCHTVVAGHRTKEEDTRKWSAI